MFVSLSLVFILAAEETSSSLTPLLVWAKSAGGTAETRLVMSRCLTFLSHLVVLVSPQDTEPTT